MSQHDLSTVEGLRAMLAAMGKNADGSIKDAEPIDWLDDGAPVDVEAFALACGKAVFRAVAKGEEIDGGDIMEPTPEAIDQLAAAWRKGALNPSGETVILFRAFTRYGETVIPASALIISGDHEKLRLSLMEPRLLDDGGRGLMLINYAIAIPLGDKSIEFLTLPVSSLPYPTRMSQAMFLSAARVLDNAAGCPSVSRH